MINGDSRCLRVVSHFLLCMWNSESVIRTKKKKVKKSRLKIRVNEDLNVSVSLPGPFCVGKLRQHCTARQRERIRR